MLSRDGIKPDPEKVRAINELVTPADVSDVRRLLGMANHLARFLLDLASETAPLCHLHLNGYEWTWGPAHEQALSYVKDVISSTRVTANYGAKYPTADASSFGLGVLLMQVQPHNEKCPVVFESRSPTPAEARYSQIQKGALAMTWAAERFQEHIKGLEVSFETDHKPLATLLGNSPLDVLLPRIQRFRMRLKRFSYAVVHVPGKSLVTDYVLSRAPIQGIEMHAGALNVGEVAKFVSGCLPNAVEASLFERVTAEQGTDEVLQALVKFSREGWPKFSSLSMVLRPYWQQRATLTVAEGVLLKGVRLVIRQKLRVEILMRLHESHQGIEKC